MENKTEQMEELIAVPQCETIEKQLHLEKVVNDDEVQLVDTPNVISSVASDQVTSNDQATQPHNADKNISNQMTYKKIILKYSIPASTHQRILEIDTASHYANHRDVKYPHNNTNDEMVVINDCDSDHKNEKVNVILSSDHLKSTIDFKKFKTKQKAKHNPFLLIKCGVCNKHFKSKKKLRMHSTRPCFPLNF